MAQPTAERAQTQPTRDQADVNATTQLTGQAPVTTVHMAAGGQLQQPSAFGGSQQQQFMGDLLQQQHILASVLEQKERHNVALTVELARVTAERDALQRRIVTAEAETKRWQEECETLNRNVVHLQQENARLTQEVASLKNELAVVQHDLKVLKTSLGARQLATTVERACLRHVWSKAAAKPFHIYTLKNVKKFLRAIARDRDPYRDDDVGGPTAAAEFKALPVEEQKAVEQRLTNLETDEPMLLIAIDTIKDQGDKMAHRPPNMEDIQLRFNEPDMPGSLRELFEVIERVSHASW
jgi:hypothetical protein